MTTFRLTKEGIYVERSIASLSALKPCSSVMFDTSLALDAELSGEFSKSEESESIKEKGSELGPSILLDPKAAYQLKPFEMRWCFGFDYHIPIVNLTENYTGEVMYISNNSIVRYDFVNQNMSFLQAHQNKITTLSSGRNGHYVVTADRGQDHCVVVWDMYKNVPIYTNFDPYPESGVLLVGMDSHGKYIITIGEATDYVVDFWLWTSGNDKPFDTVMVKTTKGEPVKITFNPDKSEYVMIVFQSGVLFFEWDEENEKIIHATYPAFRNKSKIGYLTDGTYVSHCHECYVSSDQGYLVKFGPTLYTKDFNESELDNSKIFINAIKVSKGSVTCILSVDEKVLIGDSLGAISYYDKRVKIIYWQINLDLPPIKSISVCKEHKRFSFSTIGTYQKNIEALKVFKAKADNSKNIVEDEKKMGGETETKSRCLSRISSIDCVISTADGNIYTLDTMRGRCDALFVPTEAFVASIDAHSELPYLIVAYQNGLLCLYNYMNYRIITNRMLPQYEPQKGEPEAEEDPVVTCIKYCPKSVNLVCGKSNGQLLLLKPIMLTQKQDSFRVSDGRILKIVFSADSMQLAYISSHMTTYLFLYNQSEKKWKYRARIKAHYKEVTDIMFYPGSPSTLFTLGADRCFVQYNNAKMRNPEESFEFKKTRIEQSAIPNNMTWYPLFDPITNTGFLLLADNQHKFKLINDTTLLPRSTVLGPAYGCYKNNPVRKMILLPQSEGQFMIYLCRRHIGIQILPADGNPYRFIGCEAHHQEVVDMVLSYCGDYAFTFGIEDRTVAMWDIKTETAKKMEKIGGTGMEPYYCLLEGGKNGWLFHEMQDLFYYMQVLNMGENTVLPRKIKGKIPISELPDLVRACGFYPSDYEIENMLIDIKNRDILETGLLREEITFLEFVQLYINHRPPYGYTMEELENAFDTVAMSVEDPDYGSISRENFIDTMVNLGEAFNEENLYKCLSILLGENQSQERGEIEFDFVPDDIDFSTFADDILGIDMERKELEIEEKSNEDAKT